MPEGGRRYVIGALVAIGAAFGIVVTFAISGLYNVSAAREHLDVTTWILDVVRRSSVRTQSLGIEPPPLDEPGMARLGAAYFRDGCLPCHGAPGQPPGPVAENMLPEPPSLHSAAADWSTKELFWIIHNGQKYTGMPAWLDYRREDEVWPLVAFVKSLQDMDADEYASVTPRSLSAVESPGDFLDPAAREGLQACIGCHGPASGHPVNARVPRLGGQSAAYLARALQEYKSDRRPSGMMELMVSLLTEAQMTAFAGYYASGAPRGEGTKPSGSGDPAQGGQIFSLGIPEQDVPACMDCHLSISNPQFPRLEGQSAVYVQRQLNLWKEGLRDASFYGAIMAPIANRLTPEQIANVAAYVETLPPFGDRP